MVVSDQRLMVVPMKRSIIIGLVLACVVGLLYGGFVIYVYTNKISIIEDNLGFHLPQDVEIAEYKILGKMSFSFMYPYIHYRSLYVKIEGDSNLFYYLEEQGFDMFEEDPQRWTDSLPIIVQHLAASNHFFSEEELIRNYEIVNLYVFHMYHINSYDYLLLKGFDGQTVLYIMTCNDLIGYYRLIGYLDW